MAWLASLGACLASSGHALKELALPYQHRRAPRIDGTADNHADAMGFVRESLVKLTRAKSKRRVADHSPLKTLALLLASHPVTGWRLPLSGIAWSAAPHRAAPSARGRPLAAPLLAQSGGPEPDDGEDAPPPAFITLSGDSDKPDDLPLFVERIDGEDFLPEFLLFGKKPSIDARSKDIYELTAGRILILMKDGEDPQLLKKEFALLQKTAKAGIRVVPHRLLKVRHPATGEIVDGLVEDWISGTFVNLDTFASGPDMLAAAVRFDPAAAAVLLEDVQQLLRAFASGLAIADLQGIFCPDGQFVVIDPLAKIELEYRKYQALRRKLKVLEGKLKFIIADPRSSAELGTPDGFH